MRVHRRLRGDEGAAAVEFALLLPFLALLVAGVIDLGRWFSAWNETKNAAREGAAYAQVFPFRQAPGAVGTDCAPPNNITDRARQELGTTASSSFVVTTSPAATGCGVGTLNAARTVTVTVSRKVPLITPIIRNIVGDVDITASVQAKVQG